MAIKERINTLTFTNDPNTEYQINDATGENSFAYGTNLEVTGNNQVVFGKNNADKKDLIFAIGNGSSTSDRKNILEVYTDGKAMLNDKPLYTGEDGITQTTASAIDLEEPIFFSTTLNSNTSIDGKFDGTTKSIEIPVSGILPVTKGGTGSSEGISALVNLENSSDTAISLPNNNNNTIPVKGILPIANGGTGASTEAGARNKLLHIGGSPIQSIANDTPENWARLGNGITCMFTQENQITNQPSQYGMLTQWLSFKSSDIEPENNTDITQFWFYPDKGVYYRQAKHYGETEGVKWVNDSKWIKLLDSSDSQINSSIEKMNNASSWSTARDNAVIKGGIDEDYVNDSTKIHCYPVISIGTPEGGSWEIGALGTQEHLYFSYVSKEDYVSGNNDRGDYLFSLSNTGVFSGVAAGLSNTLSVEKGGTGATTALEARKALGCTKTVMLNTGIISNDTGTSGAVKTKDIQVPNDCGKIKSIFINAKRENYTNSTIYLPSGTDDEQQDINITVSGDSTKTNFKINHTNHKITLTAGSNIDVSYDLIITTE